MPPLGKDSLGVWLSDWGWNSSVGKERWQEGFVMDLSRGSLLAQPWSDFAWLSPPERQQMADFVALLRARPACFGNPRFVLGNPWKEEPYGYSLSDGWRAFLALNNCTWKDAALPLTLDHTWGLPDGRTWNLDRRYELDSFDFLRADGYWVDGMCGHIASTVLNNQPLAKTAPAWRWKGRPASLLPACTKFSMPPSRSLGLERVL